MKLTPFKEIKKICSELLFKNYQPYKFRSKQYKHYHSVSNFFPFVSNDFTETRYVFDNAPLILNKDSHANLRHLVTLYDPEGCLILSKEYSCELPLFNVKLSSILNSSDVKYGSFTHHIKHTHKKTDDIVYHLRGYTYFSSTSSDHESMCHGNFGGIALDLNYKFVFLAKQRSAFTYTSQIYLDPCKKYSFYWNNPTEIPLHLSLMSNSLAELSNVVIKPKGTSVLDLFGYRGLVHFKSRLPIGRPVIIITDNNGFFDALHG